MSVRPPQAALDRYGAAGGCRGSSLPPRPGGWFWGRAGVGGCTSVGVRARPRMPGVRLSQAASAVRWAVF